MNRADWFEERILNALHSARLSELSSGYFIPGSNSGPKVTTRRKQGLEVVHIGDLGWGSRGTITWPWLWETKAKNKEKDVRGHEGVRNP